VKGVDNQDITHWLKKVQFKLHETYAQSTRTIESPPFEVTETGWGEFEVAIKLFFVAEAGEKPISVYHQLKLHPYGPNAQQEKELKLNVVSENYEEVVFNEPMEAFYDILTTNPVPKGKGGRKQDRSAEIPAEKGKDNPYSRRTEGEELDKLTAANRQVSQFLEQARADYAEQERQLAELRARHAATISK
jgi:YEATS domain-containing protein 4